MRQYEIAIRIAQVHHLADERKYRKALTVIQTLDIRQIRNVSDLKVFAEVFTRTEQLAEAKATYLRIYKKSRTRKILYRLIYLAIRTNDLEEAEKYYEEFVRMNPSNRDALILRYRLDKAAGVQIGQLIDTLRDLKEEEYIEEWAYELAKLYQQAGRYEECREECADIRLWFGSGEIVERAKLLLEHIQENDPMPFLDDTDFTDPLHREKPNPDDTGSLPDLSEYLESDSEQEMKLLKKADPAKFEEIISEKVSTDEFATGTDSSVDKKPEGLQKLSGLLFGNKSAKAETEFDQNPEEDHFELAGETNVSEEREDPPEEMPETMQDRKDTAGTAEHQAVESAVVEGYQEDKVATIGDSVQEDAVSTKDSDSVQETLAVAEESEQTAAKIEIDPSGFPPVSQSGTGITQDLAKEISAIYEAEHQAQLKEKTVTVIQELPNIANDVVERMTEALEQSETRQYVPVSVGKDSSSEDLSGPTVVVPDLGGSVVEQMERMAEKLPDPSADTKENRIQDIARQLQEAELSQESQEDSIEKPKAEKASELNTELQLLRALEKELQEAEAKIERTVAIAGEEMEAAAGGEIAVTATAQEVIDAVEANLENHGNQTVPDVDAAKSTAATVEPAEARPLEAAGQQETKTSQPEEAARQQNTMAEVNSGQPQEAVGQQNTVAEAMTGQPQGTEGVTPETVSVKESSEEVPSATGEVLPEKDLPTTRALHRSFDDVLILIGGEMDPSHFVLIGDGKDRILGISKRIAVVMRETGYLSSGRIAHITAEQLNVMDLSQFKKQLKGNCLLITHAAELLFPTITRVFAIMDEFYGDFTVILSDEGATLDQLFRFVPALARRFKYVIDITQYTEKDYK